MVFFHNAISSLPIRISKNDFHYMNGNIIYPGTLRTISLNDNYKNSGVKMCISTLIITESMLFRNYHSSHIPIKMQMFVARGSGINQLDACGCTPTHAATRNGHLGEWGP